MREKVVARRLSALQAFRLCRGLGGSPLIAFRLSPQACKRHLVVEPCCVRMRGARLVYRGWTAVGPISACMRGPNALCESIAELIENGELNLKLDARDANSRLMRQMSNAKMATLASNRFLMRRYLLPVLTVDARRKCFAVSQMYSPEIVTSCAKKKQRAHRLAAVEDDSVRDNHHKDPSEFPVAVTDEVQTAPEHHGLTGLNIPANINCRNHPIAIGTRSKDHAEYRRLKTEYPQRSHDKAVEVCAVFGEGRKGLARSTPRNGLHSPFPSHLRGELRLETKVTLVPPLRGGGTSVGLMNGEICRCESRYRSLQ
ncbi:hypothetical protein KC359_g83 [Hortaea werneckii]|nr:hypothetical protein KC359_g83 [Hortaea werneckii]